MGPHRAMNIVQENIDKWLDENEWKIEVEKFEHLIVDSNTIIITCHYRKIQIPYEILK